MNSTDRTNPAFRLDAAGGTDIGSGRRHNEDTVLLRADLDLFLLADGAGGHNAGNVASALATTTVAHAIEEQTVQLRALPDFDALGVSPAVRALSAAILRANREIQEIARTSDRHQGMGSTLVAAFFAPGAGLLHVGHVGDSRLFRARGGMLEQLTHDHSLINDVIEMRPDLDEGTLEKLPRTVVTRALGMSTSMRPSLRTLQVAAGDSYLLCSDGLTDALDGEQIAEIMFGEGSPEDQVRQLIDRALVAGADDNVAVIAIACTPLPGVVIPFRRAVHTRRGRQKPSPSIAPPSLTVQDLVSDHGDRSSGPEIVILSDDAELGEDPTLRIRVVPAGSASSGVTAALSQVVRRE